MPTLPALWYTYQPSAVARVVAAVPAVSWSATRSRFWVRITRSCFSSASSNPAPALQRFQLAVLRMTFLVLTGTWTVMVSVLPAGSFTPTVSTAGLTGAVFGEVPLTVPSAATDSQESPLILRKTGVPEGRIHSPPSLKLNAVAGATAVVVSASTAACERGAAGLGLKLKGALWARIPYPSLASRYAV